jgi:hypothetical protein
VSGAIGVVRQVIDGLSGWSEIGIYYGRPLISWPAGCPGAVRCGRWSGRRCGCRKPCPHRSSGVSVFVEDAAESVASSDVEVVESVRCGDRLWERA